MKSETQLTEDLQKPLNGLNLLYWSITNSKGLQEFYLGASQKDPIIRVLAWLTGTILFVPLILITICAFLVPEFYKEMYEARTNNWAAITVRFMHSGTNGSVLTAFLLLFVLVALAAALIFLVQKTRSSKQALRIVLLITFWIGCFFGISIGLSSVIGALLQILGNAPILIGIILGLPVFLATAVISKVDLIEGKLNLVVDAVAASILTAANLGAVVVGGIGKNYPTSTMEYFTPTFVIIYLLGLFLYRVHKSALR